MLERASMTCKGVSGLPQSEVNWRFWKFSDFRVPGRPKAGLLTAGNARSYASSIFIPQPVRKRESRTTAIGKASLRMHWTRT